MMNKFAKHYDEFSDVYDKLIDAGKISQADVEAAGNLGGKYSYKEQDEANKRINTYMKSFVKKNEGNDFIEGMVEKYPVVEKFEPNPSKWQEYDQEQMGRLAESLHYNWNNKEDRSKMMRELQGETIRENKKKIYQEYKKEHPVASWINENVFAPNASERSKKGEDITNKDIALDALNAASFLTPGGLGKTTAQKAAWLAGDIAANAALGVAEDLNQDRELGLHNIVAPVFGAGLGQSIAAAPRLVKQATSWLGNGADAGRVGKGVGDKIEDWLTNTFTNKANAAKKALNDEAEIWRKRVPGEDRNKYFRSNTKPETYAKYEQDKLAKGEIPATMDEVLQTRVASHKQHYANNPQKYFDDYKNGRIPNDLAKEMLSDERFSRILNEYTKQQTMSTARKLGNRVLKEGGEYGIKQIGRSVPYVNQNAARHKESDAERSDINWFKTNYARDWEAGFAPRGNENEPIMKAYREWQEENKQTKPKFRDIMRGE